MNKNKKILLTILGAIFLLIGILYQVPTREIPWDYKEYVGGDAYNIMIEASIRAGEISGATASKTILIIFGTSLLLISICVKTKKKKSETTSKENISLQNIELKGDVK